MKKQCECAGRCGPERAAVAETLSQTLFNRVKAERQGKREGLDTKFASAEQKEMCRLRAKLVRANSE